MDSDCTEQRTVNRVDSLHPVEYCASKYISETLWLHFLNNLLFIFCSGWTKWIWFKTVKSNNSLKMALTAARPALTPTLCSKLAKAPQNINAPDLMAFTWKVEMRYSGFCTWNQIRLGHHTSSVCVYLRKTQMLCSLPREKRTRSGFSKASISNLYLEQLIHLAQIL